MYVESKEHVLFGFALEFEKRVDTFGVDLADGVVCEGF